MIQKIIVGNFALGILATIASQGIVVCSSFFQLYILARSLNKPEFSHIVLLQSIQLAVGSISCLGLTRTVVREVPALLAKQDVLGARKWVFGALKLCSCSSALFSIFCFFSCFWLLGVSWATFITALCFAAWTILFSLNQYIAEALRGYHQIQTAAPLSGASGGAIFSLTHLFLLWWFEFPAGMGTFYFCYFGFISSALVFIGSIIVLFGVTIRISRYSLPYIGTESDRFRIRKAARDAYPIVFSESVIALYTQADLWIMGLLTSPEKVAIYGACRRLVLLINAPLLAIVGNLSPRIAKLHAKGDHFKLQQLLTQSSRLTFALSSIILSLMVAFPEWVLEMAYGAGYGIGASSLIVLALGQMSVAMGGLSGTTMIMVGLQKKAMAISISGLVQTWVIVPICTYFLGSLGTAAASSLIKWTQTLAKEFAIRKAANLSVFPFHTKNYCSDR